MISAHQAKKNQIMTAALILATSSSALFDLSESDLLFQQLGPEAYAQYQIENENTPLAPGPGFSIIKKFLQIDPNKQLVDVVLLSRNSADTGLRVFNSIQHHGLPITRAAFLSGQSPFHYVKAFEAHLFLSTRSDDVQQALAAGCAAATLFTNTPTQGLQHDEQIRIAFDGDAVLFSDEAEQIFQRDGLAAFTSHEENNAHDPLSAGPFKGFLASLHALQQYFPKDACPIRTALITARQAPAHKRVINTLRAWDIRIDESLFLGGLEKTAFLKAFRADIFFDDSRLHCDKAAGDITTAHVPHGVQNDVKNIT
jgi:5'-nucleotidase